MHHTATRWAIALSLLSWTATAAGAEPESAGTDRDNPARVSTENRVADEPDWGPSDCYESVDQRSALVRWWQDRAKPVMQCLHWGYPEEFDETPFGASLRAHQRAQVCSGLSARLFLYQYDFCDEAPVLNPHGRQRLNDMMAALPPGSHHALIIEATPDKPHLAAARRDHVMLLLKNAGVTVPVHVSVASKLGLVGDEARTVYGLLEKQIRSGKPPGGAPGGAVGGAMSGAVGGAMGGPAGGAVPPQY